MYYAISLNSKTYTHNNQEINIVVTILFLFFFFHRGDTGTSEVKVLVQGHDIREQQRLR